MRGVALSRQRCSRGQRAESSRAKRGGIAIGVELWTPLSRSNDEQSRGYRVDAKGYSAQQSRLAHAPAQYASYHRWWNPGFQEPGSVHLTQGVDTLDGYTVRQIYRPIRGQGVACERLLPACAALMLRAIVWMLRAIAWMLRAIVWTIVQCAREETPHDVRTAG
eukprot:1195632-Prorocentrum_minimum.AAC.1